MGCTLHLRLMLLSIYMIKSSKYASESTIYRMKEHRNIGQMDRLFESSYGYVIGTGVSPNLEVAGRSGKIGQKSAS